MSVNVFSFSSYTQYLEAKVTENSSVWGYKRKMADAAGCFPSYISHVLAGKAHLTPEKAVCLAEFLVLSAEETEFFLELVNYERAGNQKLRKYHEGRMQEMRERAPDLSKKFIEKVEFQGVEDEAKYYGSWVPSAVNLLVEIPEFHSSESIANRLSIPVSIVEDTLKFLEDRRFIKKTKNGWKISDKNIHLPKRSPHSVMNHLNWRQRAILDCLDRESGGLHYTAIHSIAKADFIEIRELMLRAITRSRDIVNPSKEEDVFAICVDVFRV